MKNLNEKNRGLMNDQEREHADDKDTTKKAPALSLFGMAGLDITFDKVPEKEAKSKKSDRSSKKSKPSTDSNKENSTKKTARWDKDGTFEVILPVEVSLDSSTVFDFTPDHFGGLNAVTADDIREYLHTTGMPRRYRLLRKGKTKFLYHEDLRVLQLTSDSGKGNRKKPSDLSPGFFSIANAEKLMGLRLPYGVYIGEYSGPSWERSENLLFKSPGIYLDQKIPYDLLIQILNFLAVFAERSLEACAAIVFDKCTKEYEIHIPNQDVVIWDVDNIEWNLDVNKAKVLEVHSHHKGSAIFSPKDDADEQNDCIYMVVGDYKNSEFNSFSLRSFSISRHYYLELEDVFCEIKDVYKYDVPVEWVDKVSTF